MKVRVIAIIIAALFLLLVILWVIGGYLSSRPQDDTAQLKVQSFSYNDKKPGGCYVAYKTLPSLFSGEKPGIVSKPFAATARKDPNFAASSDIVYFLISDDLYVSQEDADSMIEFAFRGNDLFIASNDPDTVLLSRLYTRSRRTSYYWNDSCEIHYVNHLLAPDTLYSRDSIIGGNYFTRLDTARTTILATDINHRPDFIRVNVGSGHVFLLLQPSTLTNYFLLYKKNLGSLEKQVGYVNRDYQVYWDEYYKYNQTRSTSDFNQWKVLMRYPALVWALWLLLALLLIYVIFESKRRQRIIPDKVVLTNNSLEFVEAMGQLYYQQHDNRNLARKIILQWLEYIRSRYYLNTNHLNDAFAKTLAHKSGVPLENVDRILDSIHFIQLAENITDVHLKDFYNNIQAFYLNTK